VAVCAFAVVVGAMAGLAAYVLYALIALVGNLVFYHRASLVLTGFEGHRLGPWVIVVPALGGLVVGLLARYGSPKIRGHGIPEAMEAVLVNRSRISPRVALLKPLSAALSIGTGGPFGAEGPIIQTGGALGSLVGQLLHTTAAERKVLLACGAAAGMAATFSTPIAAVILAIELLLFEFKSRSFIPLVLASTVATAVHFQLMGRGPMFDAPAVDFGVPGHLPFYLVLGVLCGLTAVAYSRILYWVEDQFEKLPVHWTWWPALGGLGLGVIGLFFPRVLGVGYETISDILNDRLTLTVLLSVLIFKSVALFISLGSGTSGGLLAPMLMGGAALGGAFATIVDRAFPSAHLAPGAFALVGMAAVFGSASRATFTFIVFAFEITRDYDAILPLMIACAVADGVALLLVPHSIMTEKLARRGLHVPHEFEADVLRQVTVGEVMDREVARVPASMRVADLAERLLRGDPQIARHHALLLVDTQGQLAGIITRGDVLKAMEAGVDAATTVLDAGSDSVVTASPDDSLHDAVARMLRHGVGRLPVVSRDDPKRLVGYLSRAGVLQARLHRLREEHEREPGWLALAARAASVRSSRSASGA
jgi:H+/Cl- antiporter ClcA/CBS domain-containing protein